MTSLNVFNKDGTPQGGSFTLSNLLAAAVPEIMTVPTDDSGVKAKYVVFGRGQATTDNFYVQVFNENAGTDRVTNGAFATDTSWTKGTGWTIAAGVADAAGAISTALTQECAGTLQLVSGQSYLTTFVLTRAAGSITLSLGGGTAGTSRASSATFTEVITAGTTQTISFNTTGFTGTLDSVTIIPCASVPIDNTSGNSAIQNPQSLALGNNALNVSIVSAATPIITATFYK